MYTTYDYFRRKQDEAAKRRGTKRVTVHNPELHTDLETLRGVVWDCENQARRLRLTYSTMEGER